MEAHYLEEEPEVLEEPEEPAIGPDPQPEPIGGLPDDDDPDDPDNDDPVENLDSDEDDEEDVHPEAADCAHNDLNVLVNVTNDITKGEIILLELACHIRHNDTFLRALDTFKNMNLWVGPRNLPPRLRRHFLPESKSALWKFIHLDNAGIQRHVYCSRKICGQYIGRKDNLGDFAMCQCGFRIETSKAKFFVTLNVSNQLRYLLSIPGIWEKLQYPRTRRKLSPTAIEDIYDGSEYKRLQREGEILANPYNLSCTFHWDGVKLSKKGALKLVPLYLRINELPPDMRQKFHLLAAVYVDKVDPNPQSFLKPVVKQFNRLSNRGIDWKPDGEHEVNSKVIPMIQCVDSPVRCCMLNMAKWDSAYGCTYCTHMGTRQAGSQRYPFVNMEGIPPFHERTHEQMIADMLQAQQNLNHPEAANDPPDDPVNPTWVKGHKGTTQILLLDHHNLREGQAVDDLHQDHEGTAKDLTELLLTVAPRVNVGMTLVALLREIDVRLLQIKTPSRISRKPRTIQKRSNWNGTEWRNWLLFYGVPCMTGLIQQQYLDVFASISHACYLLAQDVIEPADLDTADMLLLQAGRSFEALFGIERIKFNLHVTVSHKADCVRKLGPQWAYSTYNFESLSMHTAKMVTSPKGAPVQIITRSLLRLTVNAAQYDERYSEEVRDRLEILLNKERLKRTVQVGHQVHLVGRGEDVVLTEEENVVLRREGFAARNVREFKGFLIRNTRYISLAGLKPDIKSDDTFIYTTQDTFCTLRKIILFENDNGEQQCGAFVNEHDVDRAVRIAVHLNELHNAAADLVHYITITQVRTPAVRMNINNKIIATCVPNCFELD